MKVLYTGSFDPVTNGHIDIINRARDIFGEVVVLVVNNSTKSGLFTPEERLNLLGELYKEDSRVTIETYNGLVVDYAEKNGISTIVRGIRNVTDFGSESTLAYANRQYKKMETVFLPASLECIHISSTLAKEVAINKGDVEIFVPKIVAEAMREKYRR